MKRPAVESASGPASGTAVEVHREAPFGRGMARYQSTRTRLRSRLSARLGYRLYSRLSARLRSRRGGAS